MAKKKQSDEAPKGMRIKNRKAFHNYHIIEKVECGIELTGTEVKSLRAGQAKIDEAYARVSRGQVFLVGSSFALYANASPNVQHVVDRDRKLLLHRRQIAQLEAHVRQKGKTLVPLAMYFHRGWAKVELGIAEGKREYDKRDAIREREQKRDMDRAMRRRR